ncbi:hypothetical protein K469DRAFT_720275 [Zopfia rhizophila CBS 207.26]|uniref:Aminoglycoside phosphotransferase domain-containing protein n=1 Tax=Zopfia rhizophila CBS 207.26 TaxID=1314779 RepID=A0A6A6EMX8_9PEZI|nr:hypothetical protein K469DRAFT_720275 [Zopfia rhizophila CBS 207.26]
MSQKPKSGSLNWAIILSFDDGVEWVFRSPRTHYGLDEETAGVLLASEAATLKYIRKHSSIPVPEVYSYSSTRLNEIGVPFILMSKAHGSPLGTRTWHSQLHDIPNSSIPRPCLTLKEKKKVMRQLGEITSQLSCLRFDKIGSLFEEEGCYSVKTCLSPGLLLHGRHTLKDIPRGPFFRESDYFRSLISALLLHIQCLPLEHHAFFAPVPVPAEYNSYASYLSATDRWNDFITVGSKIDSSKNRLDYFITGRLLEGMIPSLTTELNAFASTFGDGFPICHPDLSASNIFVDDDCNITCIIDWAFSSTVPIATLLMTPGLPHPRNETEPSLISPFRAGFTDHFNWEDSKMIPLASWEATRKVWLFTRLVNFDALQDYNHFTELYAIVYKQRVTDIPALFREQYVETAVSNMAKILAADDQTPSDIKRGEDAYFSNVGLQRHALSRKLTIAAALGRGFVADRKLWHWIENALA